MDLPGKQENESPEELAARVYDRITSLAKFAKTNLHLSFVELDRINPSFTLIAKYCDLMVEVLKQEREVQDSKVTELVLEITEIMKDISEGVIERDNRALNDAVCQLDDFFFRHKDYNGY